MAELPDSLASLMRPDAYPHPVEKVRLIETHVSWVLLAGEFAYKIKRPVCYPFVDMRTLAQRHFFCREELRLNRRFAPRIYRDVVPITNDGQQARIGGSGEVFEYAVRMRQFDTREELDQLLAERRVEPAELQQFGENLAKFHSRFPSAGAGERYGSFAFVRNSFLENLEQLASISKRAGFTFDRQATAPRVLGRLDELASLIDQRRAAGFVRECHGDLHCRNVVRSEGRLVAFDGLEFEPAFRWIDVAEEISFLYMDLVRRGGSAHATAFINGYLSESGDYTATQLLRLYGAHRALVRAKVSALEGGERDCHAYAECARSLLTFQRRALVLTSGLSGSGKTWLARRVSQATGAIHIRSDVERKRMAGLHAHTSSRSDLDQGIYRLEANDATYRRLARCAADVIAGGFCAIVDATFQRRADRARFSELAAELKVPLVLIHCRAPDAVLRARILNRQREGGDASEADLAVLERQRANFQVFDPGEALEVIEADTTSDKIVPEVLEALNARIAQ